MTTSQRHIMSDRTPEKSQSWLGHASLFTSFALHGALVIGALTWTRVAPSGAVSEMTNAISVEIVVTTIDDGAGEQINDANASPASAMARAEPEEIKNAPPTAENEAAVTEIEPASNAVPASNVSSDDATIAGSADPVDDAAKDYREQLKSNPTRDRPILPRVAERSERLIDKQLAKPPTEPPTKPAAKSQKQVGVSGANARNGSSRRVSASLGDVRSYAAKVRAHVASRRPAGHGIRGTVIVSFSVTRTGGLGHARIATSSGSAALDQAAVSAVRNAGPFPPPPGGAGALSFSVPFHYR